MAQYVLMFVGSDEWRETSSKEEIQRGYAAVGKWWDELSKKGVLKGGEELAKGPGTATTVRRVNGQMKVFDGPFIESKEQVGGFANVALAREKNQQVAVRALAHHAFDGFHDAIDVVQCLGFR